MNKKILFEKFPGWDGIRAFIFNGNVLIAIVYNEDENPNAETSFCVYGKPGGDYAKKFATVITGNVIPVYRNVGPNEVELKGCFKVKSVLKKSKCPAISGDRILICELLLEKTDIKCE